jgi:hypothetical protein
VLADLGSTGAAGNSGNKSQTPCVTISMRVNRFRRQM